VTSPYEVPEVVGEIEGAWVAKTGDTKRKEIAIDAVMAMMRFLFSVRLSNNLAVHSALRGI